MIQFYINERGAKQYLLTRPSSPRPKRKKNWRRRECMQKVAFTFIFFKNSFLHYSDYDIVYNQ